MISKIKVYLSARISKDAHKWNDYVCGNLKTPISVFMPQKHNPWSLPHRELPKEVYEADLEAMQESHMGLLLPEYGRDCAWEVGWYTNSKKPLVVFVDSQTKWLRDWMLKGGVDYVMTNNPKTWKTLTNDPILKFKPIIFIQDISQLQYEIMKIFKRHYK